MHASIIIPAYNEADVIVRCLQALLGDKDPAAFEIIVSCNGCHDQTATLAQQVHPDIKVLSTDTASKTVALNRADAVASGFPRIYLDADVVLSRTALEALILSMQASGIPAAAPRPAYTLTNASYAVAAYYRAWLSLPYVQAGMIGCGCYALSEEGRKRFETFPNVIADDGWVRLFFPPQERDCVREAVVEVDPPRTLADLIKIKTRSRLGNIELAARYPEWVARDRKGYGSAFGILLRRPTLWPTIPMYLYVALRTRQKAQAEWQRMQQSGAYVWERAARAPRNDV